MTISVEYGIPTDKEAIQLRLGVSLGFFQQEGIDLSLRVVFGGPEIAARFDSGALKIGELGSPPATTALSRGARFRIVASSIRRRALQYVVAAPGIADWQDLRGAAIGVLSIGSCSSWFARTVLSHHGIDPDRDVQIVGLGARYPEVVSLFLNQTIQAAVLSEPNVSIGEAANAFRIFQALTDPAYCPTMQWSVIVANNDTIARDPELVRAVLRGVIRSYRHALAHPDELASYGARYFGVDPSTMRASITRETPDLHGDGQIDRDGLAAAIALQRRLRAFDTPLRVDDIVDERFVRDLSVS